MIEFSHKSVLLQECIDALQIRPDGIYAVSYTHLDVYKRQIMSNFAKLTKL